MGVGVFGGVDVSTFAGSIPLYSSFLCLWQMLYAYGSIEYNHHLLIVKYSNSGARHWLSNGRMNKLLLTSATHLSYDETKRKVSIAHYVFAQS